MNTIAVMSEPVLKRTPGIRRALSALAASKRRNANRAASGKPVMIGGEKMSAGAYRQKYGLPDRLKKDYGMDNEIYDIDEISEIDPLVEDLVKQALWQARLRVEKGEGPGHPFRGNQYARGKSGGKGGGGKIASGAKDDGWSSSRYQTDTKRTMGGPKAKPGMSLHDLRGTENPYPKGRPAGAGPKAAEFHGRWQVANVAHDSPTGRDILAGKTPSAWTRMSRKGDSIGSFRSKLRAEAVAAGVRHVPGVKPGSRTMEYRPGRDSGSKRTMEYRPGRDGKPSVQNY